MASSDLILATSCAHTRVQSEAISSTAVPSLRANFKWTFAGNMISALGQWGVLTLLARYLGPEVAGAYGLGLALSAPILAVAMLQLRSVQITDTLAEHPFADYFGTRIVWTAAAMLLIVSWAVAADYPAVQTFWVVLLVAAAKAFDSLSDIVRGVFQRHERMDYNSICLMLKGIGAVLAAALLIQTDSVVVITAAVAGMYLITFVAYDLPLARALLRTSDAPDPLHRRLAPRFSARAIRQLSWIALPLGVVMGLISLQINIPRLSLEHFADLAALGYFTAIVYPVLAGQMIVNALGQSAAPRMARYFVSDLPAYRRLLRKLLLVAGGLGLLLVLGIQILGEPFLRILYGPDFAAYHPEFVILAVATAVQLLSSCWGYALTSARKFRVQVVLVSISCAATAIAAILLVPEWGIRGAAWTVLITSIVTWITLMVAMRIALRERGRQVDKSVEHDANGIARPSSANVDE